MRKEEGSYRCTICDKTSPDFSAFEVEETTGHLLCTECILWLGVGGPIVDDKNLLDDDFDEDVRYLSTTKKVTLAGVTGVNDGPRINLDEFEPLENYNEINVKEKIDDKEK